MNNNTANQDSYLLIINAQNYETITEFKIIPFTNRQDRE